MMTLFRGFPMMTVAYVGLTVMFKHIKIKLSTSIMRI